MIAYMDGRNALGSITAFHPKEKQFTLFTSANETRQTVSIEQLKFIRLLDDAQLANSNGGEITESEWD